MTMEKKAQARRQRIPAFGEWNYAYVGAGDDWSVTQYFESAGIQAGRLVMAAIPPPKPANKVVKWRESGTTTLELEDEDEKQKQQQQHVVVVGLGDHGGAVVKKQGKQQSPVAAHARVHCRVAAAATAGKAMDQDLYHIPPDMLCHEPRKRLTARRSLWMGCLGLDCVA